MRSVSNLGLFYAIGLAILAATGVAYANQDVIAIVRELVITHHFKQPTPEAFTPGSVEALNPFLQALDPYSRYLEPERKSLSRSNEAGRGKTGFGIDLISSNDRFLAIPRKNGALFDAGFHDQQVVKTINGISVEKLNLKQVADLLDHAATNGKVRLGLGKSTTAATQRVDLVAGPVVRNPVERIEEVGQSYIRIHAFTAHRTRELLLRAIHSLDKNSVPLVLDLRYATGGDLFEVLDSLSLFLAEGSVLASVIDGQGEVKTYYALPDQRIVMHPVVILMGPSTISASEVFVKALKHHGMALTVGATTYGKCLTQRIFELPDGARLQLSNKRLLDPEGRYCEGKGLSPDVSIPEDKQGETRLLIRHGLRFLYKMQSTDQRESLK